MLSPIRFTICTMVSTGTCKIITVFIQIPRPLSKMFIPTFLWSNMEIPYSAHMCNHQPNRWQTPCPCKGNWLHTTPTPVVLFTCYVSCFASKHTFTTNEKTFSNWKSRSNDSINAWELLHYVYLPYFVKYLFKLYWSLTKVITRNFWSSSEVTVLVQNHD